MSNPMFAESSSKSSRRVHKRRERKMWKKPIRISRLPSFGFSGSDFTVDQIPAIFSGYTAESEDSSSSEMSDDSRTYSNENEEVDQVRSKSVRREANISRISSMKVLRRQSTRKLSLGGQRLKNMRSIKHLTSNSRHVLKKKNLDSVSREDLGLLEPHYLRPTSSSASKKMEKIQKNLEVARLKRMSSLKYNGLLKATCSSAMKGSKKSKDVCNYKYCSLHGRPHSHAADNSVGVPSLKRFVSMRRKFLKRQKSVNRRLVFLKRSLSKRRGPVVTGQETKQVDDDDDNADGGESNQGVFIEEVYTSENGGIDSESNGRSSETVMVDVDGEGDGGMDSMETVALAKEHGVQESKPEIMDVLNGRVEIDFKESNVEGTESQETMEDNEQVKNTENVWNDTVMLVKQAFDEILAEITDDDDSIPKNDTLEGGLAKEDDDAVVGADSSDSTSSDLQPIEERDTYLSVIGSTSHMREESDHRRGGARKWNYLKRVIFLKRFLKSLDRRERRKLSDSEESEKTIMRLRRELVGERKIAEEWMLDHALRQVVSTLAPSQKRKVKHLVKAFESLIPMDGGSKGHHDGLEENQTVKSQTILRDNDDLPQVVQAEDLEETSEALASSSLSIGMISDEDLESKEVASSSHNPAVEEELDEPALDKEEKTGDSEKQNLSTWRNLIQKHMVMRDNSERSDQTTGIEEDGDAAERQTRAVESFQKAFETILSEIPEELVLESSNSVKEEKEEQGETKKKSWKGLRKVILLKRFARSLENVRVFNPRRLRNLPVESPLGAENVSLRHQSTMERRRRDGEEMMLDYAMRQAISRLAPIERKKVELLVQAFDTVLDGYETPTKQSKSSGTDTPRNKDGTGEEGTPRAEEDCEVNKDKQRIKNVFSRFQVNEKELKQEVEEVDTSLNNVETGEEETLKVEEYCEANKDEQRIRNVFSKVHQKGLKGGEEEVDSTPRKSTSVLPPIKNVKQQTVVEKEKDSRMWKLIYKHMVTEKEEGNGESVEGEGDDEAGGLQNDARRSGTVTLVREALEKILSEIPDSSSDDQSIDSDITTDQEVFNQEHVTFKAKANEKMRVKGWNNVKKVILLKRFVSDLGSLSRLSPKTPRVLPWEPDPETEKIRLRHQEVGGKRNSEEWMLDYALRQAISTLAPSQKRKVTLLAQAFDTISLQDIGSCSSTPGSAATSRNISRQSSISSTAFHTENETSNAEIIRGKLRNLQEDTTKIDMEEKQQCSGLWRLLCKQMEDNERNQTLPEQEQEQEQELKEDTNVDGEKMEVYKTEAVELLGEVIDGISLEEGDQDHKKTESLPVSQVRINRWSNLKRVILLRRFVKALENVRKFNPKEPRFLPLKPSVEAEKVNLRHQETKNKRHGDEWMVDNALQYVVSKLTPARKLKVQLLVQAFETLSATGS
uniref:Calmodulin-binding domain-containing protein n=1 Tax=Noccaea caerulescens TaxID=107243 RepID=A0A1J3HW68_NOCCA